MRASVARSRHPKKEIEVALTYAESRGWTVTARSRKKSHAWGRAVSPDGARKVRIDGTPRSPGNVAKQIRRAVDRHEDNQQL